MRGQGCRLRVSGYSGLESGLVHAQDVVVFHRGDDFFQDLDVGIVLCRGGDVEGLSYAPEVHEDMVRVDLEQEVNIIDSVFFLLVHGVHAHFLHGDGCEGSEGSGDLLLQAEGLDLFGQGGDILRVHAEGTVVDGDLRVLFLQQEDRTVSASRPPGEDEIDEDDAVLGARNDQDRFVRFHERQDRVIILRRLQDLGPARHFAYKSSLMLNVYKQVYSTTIRYISIAAIPG